jgi:hypothetical protein
MSCSFGRRPGARLFADPDQSVGTARSGCSKAMPAEVESLEGTIGFALVDVRVEPWGVTVIPSGHGEPRNIA